MPGPGDTTPTDTAALGTSDRESFALADRLGDGSVVLAFFPGAFTTLYQRDGGLSGATDDFRDAGATVLGTSADSPFSQGTVREEHGIEFGLVSDRAGESIRTNELETDIEVLGLPGIANRAVFVRDAPQTRLRR